MTEKQKRKALKLIGRGFINGETIRVNEVPVIWFDANVSNSLRFNGKNIYLSPKSLRLIEVMFPINCIKTLRIGYGTTITFEERR